MPEPRGHGAKVRGFRDGASSFPRAPAQFNALLASGYRLTAFGYRLPASNRQAGAEMRGRLQKLGVLRESGHEHFNGCITVPVFNHNFRLSTKKGSSKFSLQRVLYFIPAFVNDAFRFNMPTSPGQAPSQFAMVRIGPRCVMSPGST